MKKLRKICALLPTKLVIYIDNFRAYGKVLNLNEPKYYGEKIQWIKLYGQVERFTSLVDKYQVRGYVKEKIGSEYLPVLYKIYRSAYEIDYDELPEKFVLKLNNGSGGNIICRDKSLLDKRLTNKKLRRLMKEKYYKYTKELQYKNIKTMILCEEYLENNNGALIEYNLHCFNGKVGFIEVHTDRFNVYKENYYYADWSEAKFRGKLKDRAKHIEKPKNLEKLIELSEILASNFVYVRVDFNAVDDKLYFGELTFTPSSGTEGFYPIECDLEIAEMIDLSKY
ncbi:glycosyl transferase [Clostridium sp. DSM 100503]|uniref:ATP-grasp fold amidoligase family protein n=1 Tax=Clostridium sp. DSM 100503 TaxID=2963282 RepID=UPI002149C8CE|nr:ATP-grasp fold amidoligase family protein [Clostridium sp. DSM 100503]MCR1951944.1 glycosyl transferase [Clostridium sp. DSM 100503]